MLAMLRLTRPRGANRGQRGTRMRKLPLPVKFLLGFVVVLGAVQLYLAVTRPGNAASELEAWQGKPCPDIAVQTLEGSTIRAADLRGQIVVLNFWATWC